MAFFMHRCGSRSPYGFMVFYFFMPTAIAFFRIFCAYTHAVKNPPWHPCDFTAIATASARIRAHGIEFFSPTAVISERYATATAWSISFFFRRLPMKFQLFFNFSLGQSSKKKRVVPIRF